MCVCIYRGRKVLAKAKSFFPHTTKLSLAWAKRGRVSFFSLDLLGQVHCERESHRFFIALGEQRMCTAPVGRIPTGCGAVEPVTRLIIKMSKPPAGILNKHQIYATAGCKTAELVSPFYYYHSDYCFCARLEQAAATPAFTTNNLQPNAR